jgi:SulP family sulfate permease
MAGLTLFVVIVPQAMAYANLAGLPPITGLYSAAVAILAYGLLGSSRHLSFGPVAIVSLITGTSIAPLAGDDPQRLLALAAALAIMIGAVSTLLGVLRAGVVVDLISYPVVLGFTAASGLIIGVSQFRDLLGVRAQSSDRFIEAAGAVLAVASEADPLTFLIGAAAIVLLRLLRRWRPRIPAVLVVAIVGVIASLALDLPARGVAVVGAIPRGIPIPRLPAVTAADIRALIGPALVITLVGYAQTIAIGRSLAAKTRTVIDPNRDLIASGVANAGAGFLGGFPSAGSLTMSTVVLRTGSQGVWVFATTSAAILVTLVALAGALEPLPRTILAAMILAVLPSLIDLRSARAVLRTDRRDAVVLVATIVATLLLGVLPGLASGVGTNLVLNLISRMRPEVVELGRVSGTVHYRNIERHPEAVTSRDGALVRVDGPVDFLSSAAIGARLRQMVRDRPTLSWIVIDCDGVTGLDSTGVRLLDDLLRGFAEADVELRLVSLHGPQRDLIGRAGLWEELVEGRAHGSIERALRSLGLSPDEPLLRPVEGEVPPERLY